MQKHINSVSHIFVTAIIMNLGTSFMYNVKTYVIYIYIYIYIYSKIFNSQTSYGSCFSVKDRFFVVF